MYLCEDCKVSPCTELKQRGMGIVLYIVLYEVLYKQDIFYVMYLKELYNILGNTLIRFLEELDEKMDGTYTSSL